MTALAPAPAMVPPVASTTTRGLVLAGAAAVAAGVVAAVVAAVGVADDAADPAAWLAQPANTNAAEIRDKRNAEEKRMCAP